mmetsp:Transcript_91578/g.255868  ORF Transcript_91578/g.255868 Transcript_91578/m.255868 type:complete len:252 (+) Transcript_91578:516-1271(+)
MVLLLRAFEDLHRLALRELPDLLAGLGAGELLRQRRLLENAKMLCALLRVDGARIALQRDPTAQVILETLALDSNDAGLRLVYRLFLDNEELADGQLPKHLAVLYVLSIGHGHCSSARVVLAVGLGEDDAIFVLRGEPADGAVGARLALHPGARLERLLPRALEELQDLVSLQRAHNLRLAFGLEGILEGELHYGGVISLLHLLQEGRALIAPHTHPTLHAVGEGPTHDPRHAQLLICPGALQQLNEFLGI